MPASSQLAITIWDLAPTGADEADGHAIPFGGTTVPLFDKDNTLLKGRQRCYLHRHKAADGLSASTTPYVPATTRKGSKQAAEARKDPRVSEMERLEALMKKHEMGEIPENKWLDQLVFRQIEKLQRTAFLSDGLSRPIASPRQSGDENDEKDENGTNKLSSPDPSDERFYLYIEFPRFDHPIVFTDHEYPAPPISSMQPFTPSSSEIRLKPPPEVQYGPGINRDGHGYTASDAGRLIRIFDPEVGIKDNPAETKHRRLVRNHRTGVLDRDLKPNAIIRDELNVRCPTRCPICTSANLVTDDHVLRPNSKPKLRRKGPDMEIPIPSDARQASTCTLLCDDFLEH